MKILALCDAPSPILPSGFARVAGNLFSRWAKNNVIIDVWAIGFNGWRYKACPFVANLFPGGSGSPATHWSSAKNLSLFLKQLQIGKYTHVWIMQDSFNLVRHGFPKLLQEICRSKGIASMYYFPVDAPWEPAWAEMLAAVDQPVAYTPYGANQAMIALADLAIERSRRPAEANEIALAELERDWQIPHIPHGVDLEIYKSLPDREQIRQDFWNPVWFKPEDIVLVNVNAFQRRKDIPRSLEILAGLKERGLPVKLVLHTPESSMEGVSLLSLARQLNLVEGLDWCCNAALFKGNVGLLPEEGLVKLYNAADAYLTTSLGEGWGLPITEALACGTPVAIPHHTACTDIARELHEKGMAQSVLRLPIESGRVVHDFDCSRLRPRVDLNMSLDLLAEWLVARKSQPRRALTPAAQTWLSWDRIAREMLDLLRNLQPAKPQKHFTPPAPAEDNNETKKESLVAEGLPTTGGE